MTIQLPVTTVLNGIDYLILPSLIVVQRGKSVGYINMVIAVKVQRFLARLSLFASTAISTRLLTLEVKEDTTLQGLRLLLPLILRSLRLAIDTIAVERLRLYRRRISLHF